MLPVEPDGRGLTLPAVGLTHELQIGGETVLIDAADLALVEGYTWWLDRRNKRITYVRATCGTRPTQKRISMHRLIMGALPGQEVDHRNHNGLDNRRVNLRWATTSQNHGNQRKRLTLSSSVYKGVSRHTNGRCWQSFIKADGRKIYLGTFHDEWGAAEAYNAAALERWGEFAHLNVRVVG